MLDIQSKYINFVKEVQNLTQDFEVIDKQKPSELISDIEGKELLVVVVGGFSAGKSTLINQYLEQSILPTALTPETALATELRCSDTSYYEAVKSDGSTQKFELTQSEEIKQRAGEFSYLKLYLNNEKLKQIKPLILVDMPGFEAPVKEHNEAILNYLSKGVYFIVLTSVEDGNITKSMLREIENITNFGKGFSFVLSKTNLRSDEDVNAVKDKVQAQLEAEFGETKEVILAGKNSAQSFEKILAEINPNELFQRLYEEDLKEFYFDTNSSLNLQISTLKASKEEIQKVLDGLQQGVEDIKKSKAKVIEEASTKFSNKSINAVIEAVANELISNKQILIPLMNNQENFSREINSIVKNVLVAQITQKMKDVNEFIAQGFASKMRQITASFNPEFEKGFADVLATATKMASSPEVASLIITKVPYGTYAYAIIQILNVIFQFFQSKKIEEAIEAKFMSEVVPSVKTQLRNELPAIFKEHIEQTTQNAAAKFEELIKQKEAEVAQSAKEKEENKKEIEAEISKLSSANAAVSELANQLF